MISPRRGLVVIAQPDFWSTGQLGLSGGRVIVNSGILDGVGRVSVKEDRVAERHDIETVGIVAQSMSDIMHGDNHEPRFRSRNGTRPSCARVPIRYWHGMQWWHR